MNGKWPICLKKVTRLWCAFGFLRREWGLFQLNLTFAFAAFFLRCCRAFWYAGQKFIRCWGVSLAEQLGHKGSRRRFALKRYWRTSRRSGMPDLDGLNLNSKLCLVVRTWLLSIFITKQSLRFRTRSSRLRNLGDGKSSSVFATRHKPSQSPLSTLRARPSAY